MSLALVVHPTMFSFVGDAQSNFHFGVHTGEHGASCLRKPFGAFRVLCLLLHNGWMLSGNCGSERGWFMYVLCFRYSQRKKSRGLRSGGREGHRPSEINLPGM